MPICYGVNVNSIDRRLNIGPEVYTGEDCMLKFMNRMDELNEHIREIFKVTIPMKALTQEQQRQDDEATDCFCWKKKFGKKVRDHCHITGEYRGAECEYCNRNHLNIIAKSHLIPAVFTNLKGYDLHHIMGNLGQRNVRVIANSSEKIVTASIESASHSDDDNDDDVKRNWLPGGIRYTGSFAFLSRGLAELANNVPDDDLMLVNDYLRRTWNNVDFDEGFRLLRKKGVYPYDWVDSAEKMHATSLPSQEEFYNELNDCGISDDDYEHAQNVWRFFRYNTFKDYHELYLVTDVLLLADVFESFRKLGLDYYGLDPAWYISLPEFAWDAMLKMTGIKLELLTEEKKDIYLLLERAIRGDVSIVMKRHVETTEHSIIYKDANNLYGHAMSQDLPIDGFRLLSSEEIQRCDIRQEKVTFFEWI
eukprot:gene2425-biopygen1311